MALKIRRNAPQRKSHVQVAEPTHTGFSVDLSGDLDHGDGNGFEPDRNRTYEANEHLAEGKTVVEPQRSTTVVADDFEVVQPKKEVAKTEATAKTTKATRTRKTARKR